MHKEILKQATEELHQHISSVGGMLHVAGKKEYIDKSKFRSIESDSTGKILFVDGGQCSIVEAPNFSLQFIRACAVAYEDGKRVAINKFEYHVLITVIEKEGKIWYKTKLYNSEINIPLIAQDDQSLSTGGRPVEITSVGLVVRKILELEIMCQIGRTLETGDVIVRDGDLDKHCEAERKWWDQLKEMDLYILGLAKTTQSITSMGGTANSVLLKEGPSGVWYYAHSENIGFVKLHEKSEYVFRLDYLGSLNGLKQMVAYSSDPIFYGYPYGLILADRFARVTNKEKEYLQMVFMHNAQGKYKDILLHMKSVDAHSILDNIG